MNLFSYFSAVMAFILANESGSIKISKNDLLHQALDLVVAASEFETTETLMNFLGEVLSIAGSKELKIKYIREHFKRYESKSKSELENFNNDTKAYKKPAKPELSIHFQK